MYFSYRKAFFVVVSLLLLNAHTGAAHFGNSGIFKKKPDTVSVVTYEIPLKMCSENQKDQQNETQVQKSILGGQGLAVKSTAVYVPQNIYLFQPKRHSVIADVVSIILLLTASGLAIYSGVELGKQC